MAARDGSWLQIVKGRSTVEVSGKNNKRYKIEGDDYGWIRMCNMLLWTEPLFTSDPKIPKRTLILNRLDAIQDPRGADQAPIYQHPDREDLKGDPINMFEFYSVLKIEGNGDNRRYLIANDRNLSGERPSSRDIDLTIVGWVPANRCTNWDTRIALECNFDVAAFEERKAKSNLQVVGYNKMGHARSHKETGTIGPEPYWQEDPCTLPPSSLVEPDYRRKLGKVTRIPLLDIVGSGNDIYKSGVISGIELEGGKQLQETPLASRCKELEEEFAPKNNVNVFFVVQGTKNMEGFRQQILDAIPQFPVEFGSTDVKLKYGALIYRNVFDAKPGTGGSSDGKLMDLFPLSSSESEFRQFLRNAEMNNWEGDPETNYPAFAYSLSEGITKAGFNEKETNVIIVIGSHGDFQYSAVQRRSYPEYAKSMDDLVPEVSAIQGQVFFVATELSGRSGRNYLDMGHRLASGTAKQLYNSTYKYNRRGKQLPSPNIDQLPDEIDAGSILIEDTGIPNGGLYFPRIDNRNSSIKNQIREIAKVTRQQVAELQEAVDDLCTSGKGEGNSIIAQLVAKTFSDMGVPEEYFQRRYQFYHEAFIPKQIKGSDHPTMKSVVFMSSEDLFLFVNELKILVESPDDPRQGVVNAYQELVKSLTGNTLLGSKRRKHKQELSQYSIKDVNEIMLECKKDIWIARRLKKKFVRLI